MTRKLISSLILLFVVNIILFIMPLLLKINILTNILFIINTLITWYIIKQIEKLYYKKYNKFSSLLYMSCPLIGICLLLFLVYFISKSDALVYLIKYYIPLYIGVMIINLIYILINYKKKTC